MSNKELFAKAEMNEDFFNWLDDKNVTGNEMAALIWSCPSWDYLSLWFDKIEYWFDKPEYDEQDMNTQWYNDFDCEKYMDTIAELYKEYEGI